MLPTAFVTVTNYLCPHYRFFTNEGALLKNVGRAYAWLSSDSWNNGYLQHMGVWMNDIVTTDEAIIPYREGGLWWDNGVWIQDHQHSWDYTHDGVWRTYSFVMDGVTRCNQILYQMEQANVAFDGSEKLVAEVKMVRAYLYLKGIDWLRNLPLVTDFTDTELQGQVRFGTFSQKWDNKTNTDSYRDIYPIPYRAMNTNSKLVQNDGYTK